MEEKYVSSQRGNTYYWISRKENAKCLVFTHGVTANHIMFDKQVKYFKDNYTIITWDVPLHGKSKPYSDFSFDNTAKDLKEILDKEKISKVILVGMSLGGYPTQMFAIKYPEMVEGFVGIDTTPLGLEYYSKSDIWWVRKVEPMAKLFTDRLLRTQIAKLNSTTRYAYDCLMQMLEPLSKNEIIEQLVICYAGFLKENQDTNFQFPVLILLGDRDKTGKVTQYCKEWHRKTGYPLHIIKDAAHFSNGDNPDAVNSEIEEFIKEIK